MNHDFVFSIKIGGQAGQGIKSSGLLLAKTATRSGYHIHTYTEFPSIIRGGHNIEQIVISNDPIMTPLDRTDFLVALNQDTLTQHGSELHLGTYVLYDSERKFDLSVLPQGLIHVSIPLSRLAGQELLINTVALGAVLALLGGDVSVLETLLSEEYSDKGQVVIEANKQAARSGFEFAKNGFITAQKNLLSIKPQPPRQIIVNGAQSVALGAIASGLGLAAIYPMSPISGIIPVLASAAPKMGFVYKQPEDEISALCMAIGAGFAGVRSMTATSGGGFCLMAEAYGLAAMTETPVVIINGMRPGPATGLPTWSGQGDLQFVLNAHQGDFPRFVLAASDARDAFYLTLTAFNLAERYQTPVILLIDKNICDDDQSLPEFSYSDYSINRGKMTTEFNPNYARYALEPDGISYRTIPGTGNFFIANSDEHLTSGLSTEVSSEIFSQQDKRMKKQFTAAHTDMPAPDLYGPHEAEVTVVSWGSNKNNILYAIRHLPRVNYLHITWMSPFPSTQVAQILSRSKKIVGIECNSSGQLCNLIREKTGVEIARRLLKYDGRPFFPEEISGYLSNLLEL